MEILINGKKIKTKKGEYVLDVARREGFYIPSLCHHPALPPDGACRLCLVEVEGPDGKNKVTTACTLEVSEGLSVRLDTPEVARNRNVVLEMLLSRVSDSPTLLALAEKYGLREVRLVPQGEKCILCGLCARVCTELVGAKAITMEGRGTETYFQPPFGEPPKDCVGCGSCAFVCPVSCIPFIKTENTIEIWGRTFERLHCTECGKPLDLTPEHRDLIRKRTNLLTPEEMQLCGGCERRTTKNTMQRIVDGQLSLEAVRR